jgi:hypothetical protein
MPTCPVQSLYATRYKHDGDRLFWGMTRSHWISTSHSYQGTLFPTDKVSHPKDLNPAKQFVFVDLTLVLWTADYTNTGPH